MSSPDKTVEKEGVDLNVEEQEYGTKGASGTSPEYSDAESKAFDRSLILKLDLLIIPLLTMVYLLAFLDRANIGNARVYQTAITVTYVPYIASEVPSNLIIKRVGPRRYIPFLCFAWGIVTTLQSQVHNYSGLLACRFFLGLMEGGLFPGIILYLSSFYRRQDLSLRIALFWSAASLSGAFSGLLAAAIAKMDGIGGMRGWQYIFLLEGLFTVVWAVVVYVFLPNSPHSVKLFTPEQAARCVERLKLDVDILENEKVTTRKVLSIFKDPQIILVLLCAICSGCVIFGLALFTPSIVRGMGYSPIRTQLMTVPPYAVAFVLSIAVAYFSDKYKMRGIPMILTLLLSLAGVIIFYVGRSVPVRYAGLFLLLGGIYANGPCLIAWMPNNTAGHTRRATAIAMNCVCNNVGGIISTWIFPSRDAPYYLFAARFMLSMNVIFLFLTAAVMWVLHRENTKKEDPEYRQKLLGDISDLSFADQLDKLGDHHPDYKYVL
ncbi:hypothetical protein, variant [Exophiala mesophila]|uniref:Major facilitator superfamily (MFS) profile domain-containing protein n=1 Tax=Exophiala mesophila TaxID=212818 RepID=A0A0D1Z8Z2_EXOME|nr:hypothetical protein, variant [Exophiala mesophila]KIV90489.1 hypothetical protein, variant [Exophiala mesophila]